MSAKFYTIGDHPVSYGGCIMREIGEGALRVSLDSTASEVPFDPDKVFAVTVTFSTPVTHEGTTASVFNLSLHAGDFVLFDGIREGIGYTLDMQPLSSADIDDGYYIESFPNPGSIKDATTAPASIVVGRAFGVLNLTRSVTGTGYDPSKFKFTVTFGRAVRYAVNGARIDSPLSSYTGSFASGASVILGYLPGGLSYTVTETPMSSTDILDGYSNGTVVGGSGDVSRESAANCELGYSYIDPIASLPERTIRFEFTNASYDPSVSFISGGQTYRWTRVSSSPNRWDCYCPGTDWTERFSSTTSVEDAHFEGQSTGDIHVLGANLSGVTNCTELFSWESRFTSIKGLFNTSSVTNTSRMFYDCERLTYVATFDTHNVTNMGGMFAACLRLESTPMLSTGKVTNMEFMFSGCIALVDVPLYDTKNVTNMGGMLAGCRALVDVPQYDTKNVTNMQDMFSECRSLKRVPQFNMAKVTNIAGMFDHCPLLEEAPSFMSGTVTSMSTLFYGCTSLTAIPAINVANIEDATRAFYNCRAIPSGILAMYQALSSTGKVDPTTGHDQCFYNCGIDTTTGAAELAQIPSDWK